MTTYSRKALERKEELRLYEWLKENYGELQGKTTSEGAAIVAQELGLDVSPNTIVSMTKDMELDPFWNVRVPKQEAPHAGNGRDGHELKMQVELALTRLNQLGEINKNLVERVEKLEEAVGKLDDAVANKIGLWGRM